MYKIPRKRKPLAIGLLRTTPFFAAGVLSLMLFYSQMGFSWSWNREPLVIFIFLLLSWTVFYSVSQQLPYSKKNIIDDLALSAFYQLGTGFRINIMELGHSDDNPFKSYFTMTYGHGYADPSKYKEKISLGHKGAPQAWDAKGLIYLDGSALDTNIDSAVKHLWSYPILDRRGEPIAVINIDYSIETIDADTKNKLDESIRQLADLIAYYWEIPA